MFMFALQALYMSIAVYYAYSFETRFMRIAGLEQPIVLWAMLPFFLIFTMVPIILIFVTYYKLYTPEKNVRASGNRKSWNLLLAFLGLVFGLVIGGFLFAKAYEKIKGSELTSRLSTP